jgi:SagB-type dehydrogenase family enzyme
MTNQRHRPEGKSDTGESPRYRRSPFLISYWLGPILVYENYQKRQSVAGASFVSDLLVFCHEPRSFAEVCAKFPTEKPNDLRDGLRRLQQSSLLESSVDRARTTGDPWCGWESWSPAASHFHFSTRDVRYAKGDTEDFSGLRQLARQKPLPPRGKKYPGAKRVRLSKPAGDGEFERVLQARRTWREFSNQPLDRSQLETLLWLSFGIQGWARIPGVGRLPLKTSPSGGALHPLEAYLLIRNVNEIVPGIYHYDPERHRLELLRPGASKVEIRKWLAGQAWSSGSAVLVFLTAVFPRAQWKYEHSRAYRVVLAEAGHVCQTFCLTATWLGLAPFCTMALAETEIERALGVDGVTESVMYAMGAGARPDRPALADRLREAGH